MIAFSKETDQAFYQWFEAEQLKLHDQLLPCYENLIVFLLSCVKNWLTHNTNFICTQITQFFFHFPSSTTPSFSTPDLYHIRQLLELGGEANNQENRGVLISSRQPNINPLNQAQERF